MTAKVLKFPPPCDENVFQHGEAIGVYTTSSAHAFEKMILNVRSRSGKPVDWHYTAGRAVVRCMSEDVKTVRPILREICGPNWSHAN